MRIPRALLGTIDTVMCVADNFRSQNTSSDMPEAILRNDRSNASGVGSLSRGGIDASQSIELSFADAQM